MKASRPVPRAATMWLCLAALFAAGCAATPVYTEPYTSLPAVTLASPLPVSLKLSYTVDGKHDGKHEQGLTTALSDSLNQGGAFKTDAQPSEGTLEIAINNDKSTGGTRSLLKGIGATIGHVLVSEPEFTPEGRRTVRDLHVTITYTPPGGAVINHDYTSKLVSVTNNTQEPTDLVPLQDTKYPELSLVENDLNDFAAELAKSQAGK